MLERHFAPRCPVLRPRSRRPGTVAAFVALLGACVPPTPDVQGNDTDLAPLGEPPDWVEPVRHGPYAVGATTRLLGPATAPELVVEVWYPAQPAPGAEPGRYEAGIVGLDGQAYRDAPVDVRGGPYPVVVFSHGYGGIRFQSTFLTEFLASHGVVVVAADHAGSTMIDLDLDGFAAAAVKRPRDVARAFDLVAGGAVAGLQVRTDAYAVVGHSFGAWTALAVGGGLIDPLSAGAACAETRRPGCAFFEGQTIDPVAAARDAVPDPRAVATVALAPGGWYAFGVDGSGLEAVRAPLVLAGTSDGDMPYDTEGRPTWEALGSPKWMATLQDAGHWAFSDICDMVPFLEDCRGTAAGYLDPALVQATTQRLVLSHVGVHLLEDDRYAPFLTGDDHTTWETSEDDPVDTDDHGP